MPPTNPIKSHLLPFLLWALGIYAAILLVIWFTQSSFLYYPPPPSKTPFNITIARPDVALGGWVLPGSSPGVLVVFGGHARLSIPCLTPQTSLQD